MVRSSTRIVRSRSAADKARERELRASAVALSSDASQTAFRSGYAAICRDVAEGMTADQAFDLASTPANSDRKEPYMAGARAAKDMISGDGSYARLIAKAYGVNLDRK